MINRSERCKQLQELADRLTIELDTLKENRELEERDGIANPVVTTNIIKQLQKALNEVELELENCRAGKRQA